MSPERLEQVRQILTQAIERGSGGRRAFLEEACAGDAELRREVESLLEARERAGRFLERPAVGRGPEPLAAGTRIGAFEIVRVLGTGGAGTVYEAIQARPRRRVALKVMRRPHPGFQEEAEILARLKHPAIAHVYEAGVHGGVPWFALEFIDGACRITEFVRRERLDVPARLRLAARVCDAVHHGHQRGILHRDLTPGNVLVDAGGRPKIIDFGIALLVAGGPERARERTGTLPYMSPEQCAPGAEPADVRADVYSLGVLLYEVLTGTLPHEVDDRPVAEALETIRFAEPVPLAARDPALRGDVDAIVHKAIARDRERRYASAAALGDDLRRHLSHRPVEAREGGPFYAVAKFARRQRVAFVAVVALVLVSVAAALVSGWAAVAARRERDRAEFQSYVANIAAAAAALRVNDPGEARLRLDDAPAALRGWEWRHLGHRLDGSERTLRGGESVECGAVSPDGELVAAGRTGLVVWRAATGEVLYTLPDQAIAIAFSPDSERLVLGDTSGHVRLLDAKTGRAIRTLDAHAAKVWAIACRPDGTGFATSSFDGTTRLWTADGEPLRLFPTDDPVLSLAFDPRGDRLWSGDRGGVIRLWDCATGEERAAFRAHRNNVEGLAPSPDGRSLASVSMDRYVKAWDTGTHEALWTREAHTSGVKAVAFAPDGETVATASVDRTVRLWGARDGKERARLGGHTDLVRSVAYDRDGTRVISFSRDGCVKIWRVGDPDRVARLRGLEDEVIRLAFTPDGCTLLARSDRGDLAVFDTTTGRLLRKEHAGPVQAFDAERGRYATLAPSKEGFVLHALEDGSVLSRVRNERSGELIYSLALSSDGVRLLQGRSRFLQTVDLRTLEVARRHVHEGAVLGIVPGPRGRLVATMDPREVRLWRAGEAAPVATLAAPGRDARNVAFRRDGRRIAVVRKHRVSIFDIPSRSVVTELEHPAGVTAVAWSPDGARIATASYDGTVRIWDAVRARQVLVLHGHLEYATALAWSPDGRTVASGGGNSGPEACFVRLWRTE